jgi:hypothetical protein
MSWFDEFPQLFRRPMSEIGFAFYVREKMKNNLCCDKDELRQTLGPEWPGVVENLRRSGILIVTENGGTFSFSIMAPGDKKRERCKNLVHMKRTVVKFETGILKGSL